jgi:predicted phosphoribosyltransferase
VICVETPARFHAVGLWYRDFEQTSDREVIDLLARARRQQRSGEDALGAQLLAGTGTFTGE